MRRFEKAMVILFFIGVLVAGSDSDVIWPWNVVAGAAIIVLVYIGILISEKSRAEDNGYFRDK